MEAPPIPPKIHGIAFLISEFTRVNFREKWRKWRRRHHFLQKTVDCLQFTSELSARLHFTSEFRGIPLKSGGNGGERLQNLQNSVEIHSPPDPLEWISESTISLQKWSFGGAQH